MKTTVLVSLIALLSFSASAFASKYSPRGPKEAAVTIMMYGDFECPFTKRGVGILKELTASMPNDLKIVFRYYPLDFHPHAREASYAAICAGEQNKFWEMHDGLFAIPDRTMTSESIANVASAIGLKMDDYQACMTSERPEKEVANDILEGNLVRVNGTPNFILSGANGVVKVNGAYPVEDMKKYVEQVKGTR